MPLRSCPQCHVSTSHATYRARLTSHDINHSWVTKVVSRRRGHPGADFVDTETYMHKNGLCIVIFPAIWPSIMPVYQYQKQ